MSILKSKHSGWTWDLKRTPFDSGGGGGGSQPTQSTSYNTNVPEYARPYVENMLQSTQAQIYNDDMTSFRPYTPYSNDPSKYFAEFTPMQQYAQSETANMQTPGQYGAASLMAGQAGMGALGANENAGMLGTEALGYGQAGSMYGGMGAQQAMNTARQTGAQAGMYGGMGSMYGQQAADMAQQGYGAGAQYAQQATDPNAVKAYMSPYMQNVVDYQKSQAIRDYGIGQQGLKAQASRAGAFGGSRQAIQEAEAQRSLGSQLQGIEATGAQQAFNNAQQQQQFGANLGLQGLQAGYQGTGMGIQGAQTGLQGVNAQQAAGQLGLAGTAQGMQGAGYGLQGVQGATSAGQYGLQGLGQATQAASTLGSLGSQQQAADLARINAQNTMGAQQQAYKQNLINQDISNYATASQYPFMQLGIMNSMLRGLPLQQTTTASYQQQPSTAQQLTGLGGAALSYMGGRREGGVIGMKEGGAVPGYKYGDLISDPQLQGMSQGLSQQQLQGRMADPQVTNNERGIFDSTMRGNEYVQSNPMAAQQMAQMSAPPQMAQAPSDEARMSGIAQAGGDMFNTMGYAGGGIIAFAGEGPSAVDEAIAKAERDAAAQDAAAKEKPKTVAKSAPKEPAVSAREAFMNEQKALLAKQGVTSGATPEEQAYADLVAKQQAGLGEATSAKERANLAKAFLKMGSNARGFLPGAIEGAESYLTGAGEIAASQKTQELALGKANAERAAGIQARARGDIEAANKHFDKEAEIKKDLQVAAGNNAATMASAGATQRYEEEQIKRIQAEYKAKTGKDLSYEDAMKRRTESRTTAADSIESQNKRAAQTALQEWKKSVMFTEEYMKMTPEQRVAAENAEYQKILGRFGSSSGAPTATAAPATPMPMPASADKAVVGQVYNTSRGPARWDGKQFVPV